MPITLASKKNCTGCLACVDACPHYAIQKIIGSDGHFYVHINTEICVECGLCQKVCPVVSSYKHQNDFLTSTSKPYAAWNLDIEQRLNSTSGGIFAAIATYILNAGGSVVGAKSDGQYVRHIVINNIEDLSVLQGSKYIQSDTSGIYQETKRLLVNGRLVLFSGTGCQIAGLLSFLRKPYKNLYTIDLACAGVSSSLIMSNFCQHLNLSPIDIRWRDKSKGWQHGLQLAVKTKDGVRFFKSDSERTLLGGGFLGGMTYRFSCYNCEFCGVSRKSDFTIADFWGVNGFREEVKNGISLLIVHSAKGDELVKHCSLSLHSTSWTECLKENRRVVDGFSFVPIEREFLSFSFNKLSYTTLTKIYAGNISRNDFIWIPYKIFRFMRWYLLNRIYSRRIQKILKNL